MFKLFYKSFFLYFFFLTSIFADQNFDLWLKKFQIKAVESGISERVVKEVMSSAKFLPKVIEYDRYQPEFYEDTFTYIKKRSSNRKVREGKKLYNNEKIRSLVRLSGTEPLVRILVEGQEITEVKKKSLEIKKLVRPYLG